MKFLLGFGIKDRLGTDRRHHRGELSRTERIFEESLEAESDGVEVDGAGTAGVLETLVERIDSDGLLYG